MGLMQRRALLWFAVPALVACGPKYSDLLSENKAFNDQLIGQMPKLASAVSAMSVGPESTCQPPTKLTYSPKSDAGDTDYVMYSSLTQVGSGSDDDKSELNFHFHEGLISSYLRWVDPANQTFFIGRPANVGQRATPLVRDTFRRIKNLKYLVVIKPQPIDREAGNSVVDSFLVELKTMQPVCAFRVTAHADPSLGIEKYNVVRRNRKTGKETIVRSDQTDRFHNALWTLARHEVFAATKKQLQLDAPN